MEIIHHWLAQRVRNLQLFIIRRRPTWLGPFQNRIKIATCVRDSWGRENLTILRPHLEGNRRGIACTHEAFSKRFNAVIEVLHVHRRAKIQIVGAVVPETIPNVILSSGSIRAISSVARWEMNIPDNGVGEIRLESQGSLLPPRPELAPFDR
jgi:hypothetical protein